MKVYNQEKTKILEDFDLTYGELKEDILKIHHDEVEGQEEEGHYEVIAEYPNGGKDVEWVVDVPYIEHQDAYDEEKSIYVYIPYSKKRIAEIDEDKNLALLMNELASTDYEAIKYAEGWFTEEEYAPIKQHREELREQIRVIIDTKVEETKEDDEEKNEELVINEPPQEPINEDNIGIGWDDEPDDPYVPNDNTNNIIKYDENNPPPLVEGPDVPTPEP